MENFLDYELEHISKVKSKLVKDYDPKYDGTMREYLREQAHIWSEIVMAYKIGYYEEGKRVYHGREYELSIQACLDLLEETA